MRDLALGKRLNIKYFVKQTKNTIAKIIRG